MYAVAIFWVCAAIAAIIFGVMIYSFATFRRTPGAFTAAAYRRNTATEILWAVIPIVILVSAAAPAARLLAQ